MKVCETCGVEIAGRDGVDNHCADCDRRTRRNRRATQRRSARESVLRSLGLAKVRGALGGTYWE